MGKKRGRKKKRPSRKPNYKILLLNNGKQIDYFGSYKEAKDANRAFLKFIEENKNVKFPVRYLNTTKNYNNEKPRETFISETQYELIIVKRKTEEDSETTLLRNEYGEFVQHQTTSDTWILYDKAPYEKEETFWVYGFHPLLQRKDFNFIIEEIIKPRVTSKQTLLEMRVIFNKLLLETTYDTNMIICKNVSDTIRLYNEIEKYCEKNKWKYLFPSGQWKGRNARPCIERIMKLTGWDEKKIRRTTTNNK